MVSWVLGLREPGRGVETVEGVLGRDGIGYWNGLSWRSGLFDQLSLLFLVVLWGGSRMSGGLGRRAGESRFIMVRYWTC